MYFILNSLKCDTRTFFIIALVLIVSIAVYYYAFLILYCLRRMIFGMKTGYKLARFKVGRFVCVKNKNGKINLKKGAGKRVGVFMFPPECGTDNCPPVPPCPLFFLI